jgi:hypothetical protein
MCGWYDWTAAHKSENPKMAYTYVMCMYDIATIGHLTVGQFGNPIFGHSVNKIKIL